MTLERHDREHGRETAGTDRHRVARRELARQRDHAVYGNSRRLGEPAPSFFADAKAVADHQLSWAKIWVATGLDTARKIDARHHRKGAHDRAPASDGQRVLEVHGAV